MTKPKKADHGRRLNPNASRPRAASKPATVPTSGQSAERMPSSSQSLSTAGQIKVWDILVRVFHWSLVTSFFTGFFITNKFPLHAYTGYIILTLVSLRIVWGFVGSEYARFSAFTYSINETVRYTLSALRMGEAREYLSHNPMGSIMVFAMLFMLLSNGIVGVMLYAAQQLEGPLEGIVPVAWDEDLLTVHTIMARVLIGLAGFHVFGVVWASWWHRQNYVLAMFTGYKSVHTRRARREGDRKIWSEEERAQRQAAAARSADQNAAQARR